MRLEYQTVSFDLEPVSMNTTAASQLKQYPPIITQSDHDAAKGVTTTPENVGDFNASGIQLKGDFTAISFDSTTGLAVWVLNFTDQDNGSSLCGNQSAPSTYGFLSNLNTKHVALLSIYIISVIITFALFIDEFVFVRRHFSADRSRSQKTIWVLAVFPVFSLTGFLGYIVPLSTPILDLVANTFMASVLYNMLELMINYMGGHDRLWTVVCEGQLTVQYATLPMCCLLPCLPTQRLDRSLLNKLRGLILQVCVFRPIIMFIAAVMWANGTYYHSGLDLRTADPYIAIINATTTITAVYGLNLCKTAFVDPLKRFMLGGKIFVLQMVLATCSLTPGFTKLFSKWGLVRCDRVYEASVHLDAIYRGTLIISMLVYALSAWFMFRRRTDACTDIARYDGETLPDMDLKERMMYYISTPVRILRSFRNKRESVEGSSTERTRIHEKVRKSSKTLRHGSMSSEDINQNGALSFVDCRHSDDSLSLTVNAVNDEMDSFGVHNSTLTNMSF